MKVLVVAVLILGLGISAMAADLKTLNDESIQLFLKLFPQYKQVAEKYGEEISENNAIPVGLQFKAEIEALWQKHGIGMEEFSILLQKVTTGLAAVKLQESGMPNMLGMFKQIPSASDAELDVIKAHLNEIEQVFEAD